MTMTRTTFDPGWANLDRPATPHPKHEHVATQKHPATCPKHGEFEATLWALQPPLRGLNPFWSQCPTCDTEMQREADARDASIQGGEDPKKRAAAERLRSAGIPERFAGATVWNWQHGMDQQRRVWDWARDYCTHFSLAIESGRCGVLLGATGTGKTHLATGILRHILEKGGTGLYVTVMSMLGRIKDTYQHHATESEAKVIAHLTSVDLLVVDEVGRQLDTNYEGAQFFRVIDTRYQRCKPTILVSNLNKAKLQDYLGDAVVDRMREAGGSLLTFDWASQRSTRRPEPTEGAAE